MPCSSSRGDPGCGSLLDCQSSRAPVPLHRQPPEHNPQRGISRLGGVQPAGATYTTVGGRPPATATVGGVAPAPPVLPPGDVREKDYGRGRVAFQPVGPTDARARQYEPGSRPVLDLQEERRRQMTQGADEVAEKRRQQAEQAVQQAQALQQAQREQMAMYQSEREQMARQQQADREKVARQQADREQAVKAEQLAAVHARQQQAEREQMARQQAKISRKSCV